ncbi:zonular occludens toxin domain-containing protein [Moraxella bovis]|uniref:zonular occludens toxin domain-containing protein n=1 Tax=Moraxella bovis TaxID=476 RepID=UPI002227679D|nr:zonular occludens toxin domain-containing protein [Moraxella bovis]UYZ82000.1 zonular occludens toxin domain-containing protein [Moraxella bovis]UYZ82009.1 zonular occludens toxin domain-containing protein [Moraxella bovis]
MIRLITSTPGSGKTCLVMEWLLREIEKGFYKEFYSNIEGIKVAGVRPLPPNADWRELNPDKDPNEPPKLIIIDECQYFDAFMKENRSANNRIGKDLSTHRHYGIDIWFITQSTKLLNDYVLENVGEHVHVHRPKKKKTVDVYWWSYCQKSLSKTAFKDADDKQKWHINENMFPLYKSTSAVTDGKARTSHKVVSAVTTFVIVAIIILYMLANGMKSYTQMSGLSTDDVAQKTQLQDTSVDFIKEQDDTATTQDQQDQQEQENRRVYLLAQDLPQDYEIRRTEPMLQVRGVMQMGGKCLAYNAYGDVMTLSPTDCKDYVGTGRLFKATTATPDQSPTVTNISDQPTQITDQ